MGENREREKISNESNSVICFEQGLFAVFFKLSNSIYSTLTSNTSYSGNHLGLLDQLNFQSSSSANIYCFCYGCYRAVFYCIIVFIWPIIIAPCVHSRDKLNKDGRYPAYTEPCHAVCPTRGPTIEANCEENETTGMPLGCKPIKAGVNTQ